MVSVQGLLRAATMLGVSDNHLLGVSIDDEVWVVSHDDDLTTLLRFSEVVDKYVVDGGVVQVLLGLVDDQGAIVQPVHSEV